MKITDIHTGMLRVPLRTPFHTALRTVEAIEDVVVLLRTDTGHTGHGSAAATAVITGDTHGSILAAVRDVIRPRLIGREVADLNRSCALVQGALEHNTSAKAAVEIALYDLWAQLHGAPLYQMLGGGTPRLDTDLTISTGEPEGMVAAALAAIERGFTALKVKVGLDARHDLARVQAIHAAVGERACIRLDANQGWTARQAVQIMRALEDAGVVAELLEQPVRSDDVAGLAYIRERIATPVMADESVFGPLQALTVIQGRAADIVNIKLMKTGGLSTAIRVADIAALHRVPCMMGCMIESSISAAAAAHLAVARSDVIRLIDLDGPSLGAFDPVVGGTHFDDAVVRLPDSPGLGINAINGLELLTD